MRAPCTQPLQPVLHFFRAERAAQMRETPDDFTDEISLLRKKHDARVPPTFGEPLRVQRGVVANVVRHDGRALPRGVFELRGIVRPRDARLVRRHHLDAVLTQCGSQRGGLAILVEMIAQQTHAGIAVARAARARDSDSSRSSWSISAAISSRFASAYVMAA